MRALISLLVLLGSILLVGPAKAAIADDWFDDEGQGTLHSYAPSVFPDMTEEELAELTIGEEVPAVDLDERSSDPRLGEIEPDSFAAPIELEDEIVGVISHRFAAEGDDETAVYADPYFGEQIKAMRDNDLLIRDPDLGAHYIIRSNQVIPVSAAALDQLAGSTSVESFLELRRSLLSTTQTSQESAQPSSSAPVLLAIVLLVLFLVGTALTIWLRRSPNAIQPPVIIRRPGRQVRIYRRGGNRVNADD